MAINFCGFFGACLWCPPNEFQWRSKRRKPKPCGKTYRAVRCAFWIKVKNPNSPAMLRAEEGTLVTRGLPSDLYVAISGFDLSGRPAISNNETCPRISISPSKRAQLRDFLDNSVVQYQIADAKSELKTSDIARNARAFTLLISCQRIKVPARKNRLIRLAERKARAARSIAEISRRRSIAFVE